jgi:hypothetical protein
LKEAVVLKYSKDIQGILPISPEQKKGSPLPGQSSQPFDTEPQQKPGKSPEQKNGSPLPGQSSQPVGTEPQQKPGKSPEQKNGSPLPGQSSQPVGTKPPQKPGKSHGGGPKTARGKSIARWNALKHGATAKTLFIVQAPHLPEFDKYSKLAEHLQDELAPGAYLEDKMLVQRFVADALIAERCDRLLLRMLPHGDNFWCEHAPVSFRYIAQGQRNFLKSLELVRELRNRVEETEEAEAEATVEAQTLGEQTDAETGTAKNEGDNKHSGPATYDKEK